MRLWLLSTFMIVSPASSMTMDSDAILRATGGLPPSAFLLPSLLPPQLHVLSIDPSEDAFSLWDAVPRPSFDNDFSLDVPDVANGPFTPTSEVLHCEDTFKSLDIANIPSDLNATLNWPSSLVGEIPTQQTMDIDSGSRTSRHRQEDDTQALALRSTNDVEHPTTQKDSTLHPKRKQRFRPTGRVKKVLEDVFRMELYPNKRELESLAHKTKMSLKQVREWFRNKRRRTSEEGKVVFTAMKTALTSSQIS